MCVKLSCTKALVVESNLWEEPMVAKKLIRTRKWGTTNVIFFGDDHIVGDYFNDAFYISTYKALNLYPNYPKLKHNRQCT